MHNFLRHSYLEDTQNLKTISRNSIDEVSTKKQMEDTCLPHDHSCYGNMCVYWRVKLLQILVCFSRMLCNRLLHLCGLACPDLQRSVLNNVPLSVPLLYDDENVQFEVRSDVFLSSEKPLSLLVNPAEVEGSLLPEISISHPIISFEEENFYELKNVFRKYSELWIYVQ